MIRKLFGWIEPFILALLGVVLLATFSPARGIWVPVTDRATDVGIVLLFFLHGAKLSREAIWDGARNWQLHLAVLGVTFVLFPLLGLGFVRLPFLPPELALGILFLTFLPSTVQSSIAFTSVARGNVAAAVCAASFSNFFGIVITPALVALVMGSKTGGLSWTSIESIVLQLLMPFVAGHLLRPWIGGFVTRHKQWLGRVDRGTILLVVYTAFGAAVVEGLWQRVSPTSLMTLIILCLVLLGLVLVFTALLGRIMGFAREEAVVLLFCGSKKSLASGVPMAGVLFAPAQVGSVLLPLIMFHQLQLIACALIAPRLAKQAAEPGETASGITSAL